MGTVAFLTGLLEQTDSSPDVLSHGLEDSAGRMRVAGDHGGTLVTCGLGQSSIVYAAGTKVRDVAVAALVRAMSSRRLPDDRGRRCARAIGVRVAW